MGVRNWLRRRRAHRRASRHLTNLLRDPRTASRSSLRPRHASRAVLLDWRLDGETVVFLCFGILRHPRPYAFSAQAHAVLECWEWERSGDRLERRRGHNLTRERGRDAD